MGLASGGRQSAVVPQPPGWVPGHTHGQRSLLHHRTHASTLGNPGAESHPTAADRTVEDASASIDVRYLRQFVIGGARSKQEP